MFDTAAEFARELGYDKTTPIRWIKEGKIKAIGKHKNKCHYKIAESEFKKIKKKPYPKFSTCWSTGEDNFIIYDYKRLGYKKIAKIIKRSENAVKVRRCILKKKGLL